VISPARTGSDDNNNNSRAVMAIDHTNNGIRFSCSPPDLNFLDLYNNNNNIY
jgi:hypothetical protein